MLSFKIRNSVIKLGAVAKKTKDASRDQLLLILIQSYTPKKSLKVPCRAQRRKSTISNEGLFEQKLTH